MQIQKTNYAVGQNYAVQNNYKKDMNFGSIYKALVVKGGNEAAREDTVRMLTKQDAFGMFAQFVSDCKGKIGLIFCDEFKDAHGLNYKKIETLAGGKQLGADYRTKSFEEVQGIIDLDAKA